MFLCYPQQSFININNVGMPSINIFVTMTAFPPSATKTPHQQLQLERNPTMAIVTYRQQHSSGTRSHNHNREMGQQRHQHVLHQHHCHHDVFPSRCNQNTAAAVTTTGTRSNNGNCNRDIQTTTQLHQNADRQLQLRDRHAEHDHDHVGCPSLSAT